MEFPDLADLIWLFEDEPALKYPDLAWPVGLHSFKLRRGDREVLFSINPDYGDAAISLYVAGQELTYLGRLRRIETLTIERRVPGPAAELRGPQAGAASAADPAGDPAHLGCGPGRDLIARSCCPLFL